MVSTQAKIPSEYVDLARRIGPIYTRILHACFGPLYLVANPSFGGAAPVDVLGPAVLPSERWGLPEYPEKPFIVDGEKLFANNIVPLTILTNVAPASAGTVLCVPVYFSPNTAISEKEWTQHPGGNLPRSLIRLSITTLAKLMKYNADRDGGVLMLDPATRTPVQITNALLQYIAASPNDPEPPLRLKLQRVVPHENAQFKGVSVRRRGSVIGQAEPAAVFDPVSGQPHVSASVRYRSVPLPDEMFLPLPSPFVEMMGGVLPS